MLNNHPQGHSNDRGEQPELHSLIHSAQQGSRPAFEQLFAAYYLKIRRLCSTTHLPGAEFEDVLQEGSIGFYKAVLSYRDDTEATFDTYMATCIRNHLSDAVRSSNRRKHSPLNDYISFQAPSSLDELPPQLGSAPRISSDPFEIVVTREAVRKIRTTIEETLSPFEQQVLDLYISGKSYQEIAGQLDRPLKSVDNAISRIRRKLRSLLY